MGFICLVCTKKHVTPRFGVDYQNLISFIINNSHFSPKIGECKDSFADAKVFSTFDTNCGYQQIALDRASREKTIVHPHLGLYQYREKAFGFNNSPVTFQIVMNLVLYIVKCKCSLSTRTILSFSKTAHNRMEHSISVLRRLKDAGFAPKLNRCTFSQMY